MYTEMDGQNHSYVGIRVFLGRSEGGLRNYTSAEK